MVSRTSSTGTHELDLRTLERELDEAYAAVQVAYARARCVVFDRHPTGAVDEATLTGAERVVLADFRAAEASLARLRAASRGQA